MEGGRVMSHANGDSRNTEGNEVASVESHLRLVALGVMKE